MTNEVNPLSRSRHSYIRPSVTTTSVSELPGDTVYPQFAVSITPQSLVVGPYIGINESGQLKNVSQISGCRMVCGDILLAACDMFAPEDRFAPYGGRVTNPSYLP